MLRALVFATCRRQYGLKLPDFKTSRTSA